MLTVSQQLAYVNTNYFINFNPYDFMSISEEDEISENVLRKNSEAELLEEDKIYILAVISRLRRILNWDPGDDDSFYEKRRGPIIVRDLLHHFDRWKVFVCRTSNLADVVGLQHLIIYSLAKLCFYYWIQDSNIVSEILSNVYICDGHFSSMFAHIINRYDRQALWRPLTADTREKEHSAMVYFLYHANKARLQFNGVRFVDLRLRTPLRVPPAFLAAIYNKPQLLLLFLRYGANLWVRLEGIADDWNLPMLLRHLTRILWTSFGNDLKNLDFSTMVMSNTLYDVAQCLKILLRVIPQVDMGELDFPLLNFDHGVLTGSSNSHEFILWISEKELVPKLALRYLEPSELKHLSRLAIRKALNENWKLPYGIPDLPLPTVLLSYVDLLED